MRQKRSDQIIHPKVTIAKDNIASERWLDAVPPEGPGYKVASCSFRRTVVVEAAKSLQAASSALHAGADPEKLAASSLLACFLTRDQPILASADRDRRLNEQFSPIGYSRAAFVGRERELLALRQMLSTPRAIVEVVGPGGIGKTALTYAFADRFPEDFPGGIERVSAYRGMGMSGAFDWLSGRLNRTSTPTLLLIDDAELLDSDDTNETIGRLQAGPPHLRVLISARVGWGVGDRFVLPPLTLNDFATMIRSRLGDATDETSFRELWEQTDGSPRVACMLLNAWCQNPAGPVNGLGDLLQPINVPGLLGPDGRPIRRGSKLERPLIGKVKLVSGELLRVAAVRPDLLLQLQPREFEEFAAELFQKQGFEVTLTQQTRDGGKDLYLAQSSILGSFRYAVECKRYAPDNPVRVEVIRSLYGVVSREKLTAGIVLTTSHFTRDAIEEAEETRYQMSLQDFACLRKALEPFRR